MVAGVDGCKDGWVAAIAGRRGRTRVAKFSSFSALVAREDLSLIVIDVPIGLLESGSRQCDLEARKLLGFPRRSSVFPAPLRPMLDARDWEEACVIRLRVDGKWCNKQVMGILPKILEVDQNMRPDLQLRVREGHPEVSFAVMNGGRAMRDRKSTPQGRRERLRLLSRHFSDVRESLSKIPGATTDLIDAYALLWTARRILRGEAMVLPPNPEIDARSLRAEVLA